MKVNGIKFNEVKEDAAKHFLNEHNYYFKLSAYRKNYEKKIDEDGSEKYQSLDFAYLQELSTIDMHLRYEIIKMCLDIEHALKVNLIQHVENNPDEDGYNIARIYLDKNPDVWSTIQKHKSSSYCEELIGSYPDKNKLPVWVLVELISFGNLVFLYKEYADTYNAFRKYKLLHDVADLRNAAAHSNCLINKLTRGNTKPKETVRKFVANLSGFGNTMINTKLSNKTICGFITMLYVYENVINSESIKQNRYRELFEIFSIRMVKNKQYFKDNECIKTAYEFCKIIVDNLYSNAYNVTII